MLLRLAWRNIWRNRRRSLITILAVVFATFLALVQRGIDKGTDGVNIAYVANLFTGHFQVQVPGYLDAPSLRKSFRYDAHMRRTLQRIAGVKGAAPRLMFNGLLAKGDRSYGALVCGVDAASERRTTRLEERLRSGNLPASGTWDVVLGRKLCENLHAAVGDTVVILSQAYDGSLGNMRFRICGTVTMGSEEYDAGAAFVDLGAAQELLSMPGRVTAVAVTVRDADDLTEVVDAADTAVRGAGLVVHPWDVILPDVKQAAELNEVGGKFFLAILMLVVGFGILNTLLMSITERFREFGILLAVGMPNSRLAAIVALEVLVILTLGLVSGSALAYAVNAWVVAHPIPLAGEMGDLMEQYGYLPVITSTTRVALFTEIGGMIIWITLIAAVYPVARVLRLEPMKGIRHT